MDSVKLNDLIKEFHLEIIRGFDMIDTTELFIPDITRPGLQLAGHYMHFGPDRIQLIGNMEIAYLKSLTEDERRHKYNTLFSTGIPCLIISRNHQADPVMLEVAAKYKTPVLSTSEGTAEFYSSVSKYLNVELAERISIHGVFIEVYGEGILMLGDSGVGKSETALEIVKRGHRLIADDLVEIRKVSDTTLLARAPEIIRHLIEIRGIGILDVKELYGVSSVKMQENIQFVINLEFWNDDKTYDRMGLIEETTEILGIEIPSITIPVRPGRNLAIIVEVAAINFRQKNMGYNAALALTESF
ncbi:MAG TPA: HPr(Ser) kinase/phosphatase [Clostridiaceae bacterium]|nr:HPr(Ser) kinase/phosphatase [Clostridiaceae bacterium]